MELGHIHLARKIWNNPVLREPGRPFSRREAWLWIISIQARGTDDAKTGLKRGEFQASIRYMAKAWLWSKSAVERFMDDLQSGPDPMIMRLGQQMGQFVGHFKVCKYETYNKIWDNSWDTNWDKVNKEERKKKQTSQAAGAAAVDPPPSVESLQLSEKLKAAIAVRDPNAKAGRLPDLTHWARDIEKLIRIDGRRSEDIEKVIVWCQSNGCFWGPNILSGRKLREKFDTMWGQMRRNTQVEPNEQQYEKINWKEQS